MNDTRAPSSDHMVLTNDELAFLRLTCQLFTNAESPLAFLDEQAAEPADVADTYERLHERGLLQENSALAIEDLARRIVCVGECAARVRLIVDGIHGAAHRDFYISDGIVVEYLKKSHSEHLLGAPTNEEVLVQRLEGVFEHTQEHSGGRLESLKMTAGDYLVFAVFARDVREQPEQGSDGSGATDGGDSMSIDEVLAYFDEPESKMVRAPNDDSWSRSVASLKAQEVLVEQGAEFALHPRWHLLAKQITADRQHVIARYDFLDDQWLVREICLYPTCAATYRFGTQRDGSVVIEPLTEEKLSLAVAKVVRTLPKCMGTSIDSESPHLMSS